MSTKNYDLSQLASGEPEELSGGIDLLRKIIQIGFVLFAESWT
jgi:hypothetical protein